MKFILFLLLILNMVLYSQDMTENINETNQNSNENTNNIKVRLNLEDALKIASDNDKTLKQSEYDVKIAQAQKDASFSDLFLPSLSVGGSVNLGEQQELGSSELSSSSTTWSANATLSKTLFTGFKNWNTDKANDINLKMKKNSYYDYA